MPVITSFCIHRSRLANTTAVFYGKKKPKPKKKPKGKK